MTTIRLRKPILLLGALSVSLATLAVETSAQSRPTPEHPLSDAMAEALQSPFHGDRAPPRSTGHALLPSSTASPRALPGRAGVAASPSSQPPDARIPAPASPPSAGDDTHSRGKMFLLTAIAAAVGHYGTYNGLPLCLTATLAPGEVCVSSDDDLPLVAGYLATVAMTGGAAKLAGGGFWKSQAGSALGLVGGWLAVVGIQLIGEEVQPRDFNPSEAVLLGVSALGHAAITTLVVG